MSTHYPGETHPTAAGARRWPTAVYVCIVIVGIIIGLLFVMPGLGTPGGGGPPPVRNVPGEHAAAGNPQAGETGGPAPAQNEADPLAR